MTPLSRRSEKPDRSTYYRTTAPSETHHTTKTQEEHNARPNQRTTLGGFSRQLTPRNVPVFASPIVHLLPFDVAHPGRIHGTHETGTNDSSTELPMNNTPQRKRWVATASCVGLVAVIAGGGYWSNYVYLSDLTALDAWNRYMDLVKDGKYNDAVRYFPELATLFDGQFQHDFLRDAAHAHAPSKSLLRGAQFPTNRRRKRAYGRRSRARFDSTTAQATPTPSVPILKRPRGGTVSSACGRSTTYRMGR